MMGAVNHSRSRRNTSWPSRSGNQTPFAGAGFDHAVVLAHQGGTQKPTDRLLVLDDQDQNFALRQ
jgi:hypothetical protein